MVKEKIGAVTYYYENKEEILSLFSGNLENAFSLDFIEKQDSNIQIKGGRGSTFLFSIKNKDLVLRHYYRGGFIGKILKDLFFCVSKNSQRAKDEYSLLLSLKKLNLPSPIPLIARVKRSFCFFYKSDIVIEQLNNFEDLASLLYKRELFDSEYFAIGSTIKKFFSASVVHTDLNLRNILMHDEKVCLIDFDKCYIASNVLDIDTKKKMLNRLLRSFNKEKEIAKRNSVNFYFKEEGFKILYESALFEG